MEIYAALCYIRTRKACPSLMTTFAYYPESPRQTLHWTPPPPQECPATDRQCMLAREGEGGGIPSVRLPQPATCTKRREDLAGDVT